MKNRIALYIGACLAAAQLLSASAALPASGMEDTVMLGGIEVHATRIIAKYKQDARAKTTSAALSSAGSTVDRQYRTVPGLVLLDDADAQLRISRAGSDREAARVRLQSRIEALKATGLFEYVEPDHVVRADLAPTDSAFLDGTLWGLLNQGKPGADINATNAWSLTTGSTNVIVAVIDTGVRYTHRELTNQMWVNPEPGSYPGITGDIHGINAPGRNGNPMDDNGHGTHVAGTIGAAANDGNPHVGVAWNVQIMACKFLRANGFGTLGDEITCIDYAVAQGARIINASFGGTGFSRAEFDAVRAAADAGVLFVAAAGNDALNNDIYPHYPANFQIENIISVAALDRNDNLSDFSDYGARTVHIGAPGESIFSTWYRSDDDYNTIDGTSMATPHVAGVAALILGKYPTAPLSEVRQRILLGAVPVPALDGKTTTGGRLNAYNSLTVSGSGVLAVTVDPPSGSAVLMSAPQTINVSLTDLFGVIDGTVTATIPGLTNLTFLNDGVAPDAVTNDNVYTAVLQVPASTNPLTMTIVASAPGKVSTTNTVFYNVLPPPPNDYFTNATKVPAVGGLYSANNRFATLEPNEPQHADIAAATASLWWSWAPATDTNVFIETTGSSVDNVLAVYTGSSLLGLTEVAATNATAATRHGASVKFAAKAGVAYRIAVASADTNSLGSIQLRIAPGGQADITPPVVVINVPQSGATMNEKVVILTGTAFDLAPNATGVSEVQVTVNGSIAQRANGTTNWTAPVLLSLGFNTVEARAVDHAGNFSSPATIQIRYLFPAPANDFLANAVFFAGVTGTNFAVTTNATTQVGEPNHAGIVGGRSVWWKFQAPADGVLVLNTTNSSYDTLLALYTGTDPTNLTLIAASDDAYLGAPRGFSYISQAVRSNQTYLIAVDGYDGAAGDVVLTHSFVPGSVYRVNTSNTLGGGIQLTTTNIYGGIDAFPSGAADVMSNTTIFITARPDSSHVFAEWQGSIVSLENPLPVTVSGNLDLQGQFILIPSTDGFESGNLAGINWVTSGNSPWFVQNSTVQSGSFAARSGAIGNNGTSSLKVTAAVSAGSVSFSYRVSSEQQWDRLGFYIDGTLIEQWSGEVGWANYARPVQPGTHTFEWRYTKDSLSSMGEDAAFLDNVTIPLVVPVDNTTPARLSIGKQSDGLYFVTLQGQANQTYVTQVSTNLANWSPISTNIAVGGTAKVVDPQSGTGGVRYYRAITPQ